MIRTESVSEQVLEEAVREAQANDLVVNEHFQSQIDLNFSNSQFLQLLFNSLLASRSPIYRLDPDLSGRLGAVCAEIQRTIKTLMLQDPAKYI